MSVSVSATRRRRPGHGTCTVQPVAPAGGRYAGEVPSNLPGVLGWLRTAVGAGLVVGPGPTLRLSRRESATPASILLLRTIGIRDVVLGSGTVAAARSGDPVEVRRWTMVALSSDSLDVVASLVAARAIGRREALGATAAAVLFVALDLLALRAIATGDGRSGPAASDPSAGEGVPAEPHPPQQEQRPQGGAAGERPEEVAHPR